MRYCMVIFKCMVVNETKSIIPIGWRWMESLQNNRAAPRACYIYKCICGVCRQKMNILLWMMASSYFWFRERLSHSYERGNLNVLFSNNMLGVNIKSLAFRVLCIFYLSNKHITYSFSWLFDTQNVRVWQREITEKKQYLFAYFKWS